MKLKSYDWHNTIIEISLGAVPMALLLWMSNGPLDFRQRIESYIPNNEIQLLIVCYFLFGLAFSSLNLLFNFSKTLFVSSLEFISAFISIGQAFAGIFLFACCFAISQKLIGLSIVFAFCYYCFHVVIINTIAYQEYLKRKD